MDGKGIHYSGDSAAVDFKGEHVVQLEAGRELVRTLRLQGQALLDFRARFPAHLDADAFDLR
jgi:predicted amidohydrolase